MKHSFYQAGDRAITISFGNKMSVAVSERIHTLHRHFLQHRKLHWLDVVPAFTTITIVYDLEKVPKGGAPHRTIRNELIELIGTCDWNIHQPGREIEIPVCYDPRFAFDGQSLIRKNKIKFSDLIRLHTKTSYHVFMIGFLPGFAYMGPVNKKIAMPRLSKPRALIPGGSVGIAGLQTGIYPLDSPGGWNIIGRSPVRLFDPANDQQPVSIKPGDRVRFVPITMTEFNTLAEV
jgi:inhibitor of KinA